MSLLKESPPNVKMTKATPPSTFRKTGIPIPSEVRKVLGMGGKICGSDASACVVSELDTIPIQMCLMNCVSSSLAGHIRTGTLLGTHSPSLTRRRFFTSCSHPRPPLTQKSFPLHSLQYHHSSTGPFSARCSSTRMKIRLIWMRASICLRTTILRSRLILPGN